MTSRPFAIAPLSTYHPDHLNNLRIFLSHFLATLLELISDFIKLHVGIGTRTTNLTFIVPTMSSEPASSPAVAVGRTSPWWWVVVAASSRRLALRTAARRQEDTHAVPCVGARRLDFDFERRPRRQRGGGVDAASPTPADGEPPRRRGKRKNTRAATATTKQ